MEDTFTLLPLHIDPQTKAVSCPSMDSIQIEEELHQLNATHTALIKLGADAPNGVPPPPLPLNPKRSAMIQKMREQGNAALSRRNAGGAPPQEHIKESLKCYSYAIEMAIGRPPWEPVQIVRDELSILMSNRSQSFIGLQAWPEAAIDAETSIECKPAPGQGKAWWRRGRSLLEMGRFEEALEWVTRALEVEGQDATELKNLHEEIEKRLKSRREKEAQEKSGK
jgi:translocation protein SEC72